jgi:acyl-CoA synthetase (AMP-forming)/AMP-acid ligase II/acyl carrier protein
VREAMSLELKYLTNKKNDFSTFIDLLRDRSMYEPNRIAYTFLTTSETEEVSITYQQLEQQSQQIAVQLQSLNAEGSRALLLYPPGLEFIKAFFGCLYAGVVAVPAYPPRPNQSMSRLQAIVADAQATIALTTTDLLPSIERQYMEFPSLKVLNWLETNNIKQDLSSEWYIPKINGDTLALIQYTSGSTNTPKGVMLSHSNLLHNSAQIQQFFEHTPDSRGFIWLPPYHDMGLIGGILQPLYSSFPTILMSPVDFLQQPVRWLQGITKYKSTTSGGPNFAYDLCVRKITPKQRLTLDLSSWEVAFNGAEPIRSETLEAFITAFAHCGFSREAFYPCYGMAETTLIVSGGLKANLPTVKTIQAEALELNQVVLANNQTHGSRKLVGCGQTNLNQKIVIADPNTLTSCLSNQVGEIWVAGKNVSQGYWNRFEETKHTFQAYLADTKEGPFLRTGDLGFIENEELFVTGRLKDLIIIRGRNHYPHDIEMTVEKSHPALRSSHGAAFSIDVDGKEQLVIVHELERSHIKKVNLNELVSVIFQAVAQVHEIQVHAILLLKTATIPKTSSGKIKRYACRTGFLNKSLSKLHEWTSESKIKSTSDNLRHNVHSLRQQSQVHESEQVTPIKSKSKEHNIHNQSAVRNKAMEAWLIFKISNYLEANFCYIENQKLDVTKSFEHYGLDSVAALDLLNQLEIWLGYKLPHSILYESSSIEALAQNLASSKESSLPNIDNLSNDEVDFVLENLLN